jgi:hypothetical protein
VFVYNGSFRKSGGTIYGDTDNIPYPTNGNATDNTALTNNTWGHAVRYSVSSVMYYRDTMLDTTAAGSIDTGDTLPGNVGETLNNWTKQ